MKIKIRNLFFLIIISLLTLNLAVPKYVRADGMVLKPDPFSDRWDYSNESNQQAFINYEDGLEKMILSIGIEEMDEDNVWIFPVPSNPEEVAIDVVTYLPRFNGEEISGKAKSYLSGIKETLLATQIYPTIIYSSWGGKTRGMSSEQTLGITGSLGGGYDSETDVIVHEHIDKEGITSEIITAQTAQGLYQYLQEKGLNIEEGSIPVLDYYIGKEFTFIVSWIQKVNLINLNSQSQQRGVFVTFKTDEIYYPLIPTSVYGSEIVPASIRIIGHRTPKIFQDITNYTEVKYFIDNYSDVGGSLKNLYNSPSKYVKYTKIEIEAPSKFLKEDLWIGLGAPLKTYYSLFFSQHPFITGILLLVLFSVITSIIVGLIVFKDLRNKTGIKKLAFISLPNCLSIIGICVTTILAQTKKEDDRAKALVKQLREKGYAWKRRLALGLLFPGLAFLSLWLLILPNIIRYGIVSNAEALLFIAILAIPIASLIAILVSTRVKTEDKPLFEQLKSFDYSAWSFRPRDGMKWAFVPLFSIGFIVISLLLIKLVEFTV